MMRDIRDYNPSEPTAGDEVVVRRVDAYYRYSVAGLTEYTAGRLGVVNVLDYGAVGDGTTDDTAAFADAYAAVTNRGQIVLIPPSPSGNGYLITDNVFTWLTVLGCTTLICDRINTSAQLIIETGHRVFGTGYRLNNAGGGGSINATSSFPNSGNIEDIALIRMGGASNAILHGAQIRNLHLSCDTSRTNCVAIYGDGLQEHCAITGVTTQAFNEGIILGYGASAGAAHNANFIVEDNHISLTDPSVSGRHAYGIFVYSGAGSSLRRNTVTVAWTGGAVGDVIGIAPAGYGLKVEQSHIEGCYAAIGLGCGVLGWDAGVSATTYGIAIDGVTGLADGGGETMTSVLYIEDTSGEADANDRNRVYGCTVRRINGSNANVTNVVVDEGDATAGRPAITLGRSTYANGIGHYDLQHLFSGASYPERIVTDAHTKLLSVTLASGDTSNYSLGSVGEITATGNADGTSAFTGFAGGYRHRELLIWNSSAYNVTLKHNTTSTAGNRIWCNTVANIALAQYEMARLVWGIGGSGRNFWVAQKL